MKLHTAILSGVAATFFAVSANAAVINGNSLQTVLDEHTGIGSTNGVLDFGNSGIDAMTDQTGASIWSQSDSGVSSSYTVNLVNSGNQNLSLGIFSSAGSLFLTSALSGQATFDIDTNDTLYVNGGWSGTIANFGQSFGFFVDIDGDFSTTGDRIYTTDTDYSVAYLLASGTNVSSETSQIIETTQGNDDWIIAFETGTDMNFSDAVFHIEDVMVSAPATLALMGLGLVGFAYSKRRKTA